MPKPRKPESLRRLDGETRPSRLRSGYDVPPFERAPRPPSSVNEDPVAREIWDRLAPPLIEARVLTVLDEPLFGALCSCLSFAYEAHACLVADGILLEQAVGNGGRRVAKHPAAQIYRDMLQTAQKLAGDFGITQLSREALGIRLGDPEDDPLERILAGG
jgi:P27 family predicted phage terminase small subunit